MPMTIAMATGGPCGVTPSLFLAVLGCEPSQDSAQVVAGPAAGPGGPVEGGLEPAFGVEIEKVGANWPVNSREISDSSRLARALCSPERRARCIWRSCTSTAT